MPELSLYIPFHIAFLDVMALVKRTFSFADADFGFDPAAFKIEFQRDKGEAFFISLAAQALYLLLVGKELSLAERIMVEKVSEGVRRNVQANKPELVLLDFGVCVSESELAVAHGFYLGADQYNPALDSVCHLVVEMGFFVDGKNLLSRVLGGSHAFIAPRLLV